MPYVPDDSALNLPEVRLPDLMTRLHAAGGRIALVGVPEARCVLLRWEPGESTERHRHPHAVELFLVLEGELRAWLETHDGIEEVLAGPGTLMFSRAGRAHRFTVAGSAPVILLAFLAPNEDRPDETTQ